MKNIDIIKDLNKKRLSSKNKWVIGLIDLGIKNPPIQYKIFDTWIQVFQQENEGGTMKLSNCMGRTVKDYKNDLTMFLSVLNKEGK